MTHDTVESRSCATSRTVLNNFLIYISNIYTVKNFTIYYIPVQVEYISYSNTHDAYSESTVHKLVQYNILKESIM